MYYNKIRTIEANAIVQPKFTENLIVWHDWLGYPGLIMMSKIFNNLCGHSLKNQKFHPNDIHVLFAHTAS